MVIAVFAFILTLILVVGLHELGHALAAHVFGVKINRVSIGFGKPIAKWTSKNGCEWVWARWPLGGSVQLLNSRISPVEPAEYGFCFDKKPIWIRIIILFSGALANFISAWLAFAFVFFVGLPTQIPQVQAVQPNSIAAQAGLLPGDQLVSIANYPTSSWQAVGMELIMLWGSNEVTVGLKRAASRKLDELAESSHLSEFKEIKINLSHIKLSGREKSLLASMGISPNLTVPKQNVRYSSFKEAIHHTHEVMGHLIYFYLILLKQLLSAVIPFAVLLGPLGLFSISAFSLGQGLVVFMYFIASLSVVVGFVNLFPIPGLDGGSILYSIIEKIRGKPISIALEVLLHQLLFIIACVFLVQVILNDIQKFYTLN